MPLNRRDLLASAAAAVVTATAPRPARAAWKDRKRYQKVFGYRMAYIEVGSGRPIIFLHGNPMSSYLWRKIIPYVSGRARCIAPDLMGMGDSDKFATPGEYTFPNHRRYLSELFRLLGADRDVILVIHDWGSALGFYYAYQHPDAIRGIAYMESFLVPPWAKRDDIVNTGTRAKLFEPGGESVILQDNAYIEGTIKNYRQFLTAEDEAEYRRPFLRPGEDRRVMLELTRGGSRGNPQSFAEIQAYTRWLMTSRQIPKLFISANPGEILKFGSQIVRFASNFPNQKVVTVPGRHFIEEESPDAVGRALAEWLAELDAGKAMPNAERPSAARPNAGPQSGETVAAKPGEMVGPNGKTARQMVNQFDRDGDGRIGAGEFPGPAQRFKFLDGNGDGFVTVEELEARWRAMSGR